MSTENFATIDNAITTSWFSDKAVTVADEVLFTLTVQASTNGTVATAFDLNSSITRAEAYVGGAYTLSNVELRGDGSEGAYTLYQNEPNPFSDATMISFNLPADASATLTIYDVTGKVINRVVGSYAKGYNNITLTKADLKEVSGVLYYQLDSGDYTMTKKMIIIE